MQLSGDLQSLFMLTNQLFLKNFDAPYHYDGNYKSWAYHPHCRNANGNKQQGVFEQRVIDGDMVVEQLGVLGCDLLFLYSFYHYGRAIGKSYDLTYHPQKRTVGR